MKLSPCRLCLQEDMNLNEERKAPLREKDLSTKREMVVQYISATAKSVSEPVQILQCCVWRSCRGCHPAAEWIHPQSSAPWLHALSSLVAHAYFDSLPLALFAMLDSHSSDCDFDFVAFTFSAQTSSGRSESSSLSHSMQGGWSVFVELCTCMQMVGFPLVCLHGSIFRWWLVMPLKKQSWRN